MIACRNVNPLCSRLPPASCRLRLAATRAPCRGRTGSKFGPRPSTRAVPQVPIASIQDPRQGRLHQQPKAASLQVFRVVGDGACMFRSIVQGVQIAGRGSAMSVDSETQAAFNLRKAVVAELAKRRSDIEPFIPGIFDGDLTFEDYLERMSHPSAWGGEPEMVMASSVVRMPITVWRVTPAGMAEIIVTYGEDIKGVPSINLLWYQAGHYDLLVMEGMLAREGSS